MNRAPWREGKSVRTHPTEWELERMSDVDLRAYAASEAEYLSDQKQTAVPRLLRELIRRLA